MVSIGNELGMLLAATIGGIIIYGINYLKDKIKERKSRIRESIPRLVENDVEVYKLLSELLIRTKASRAMVLQFHNGTHYVNAASQMKMSCTHEIVADGISKEAKNMQNMLVSQHATTVNDIISSDYTVLNVCNNDVEDFKQILRSQGVETAIYAPFSKGHDIEGFIGITYLDPLMQNFSNSDKIETELNLGRIISNCSLKIGYLLRRQK